MEALAIIGSVASIAQLIDTAAKLSINLYTFASALGEADEDINAVALEISLFANTLDQLKGIFEKNDANYSTAVLQNTENVIGSCRDLFKQYETLLSNLSKPSETEGARLSSISLTQTSRVKWAFKQKRVEVLRRRLAALQTNLQTMLHALTLSELQSIRSLMSEGPQSQVALQKKILRSCILANRASVSSLEEAENNAELAGYEANLTELEDETIRETITQNCGKIPSSQAKRDSIWLSEAISEVSAPSENHSEAESVFSQKSTPKVKDYVSRYSCVLESDMRPISSSDWKVDLYSARNKQFELPSIESNEEIKAALQKKDFVDEITGVERYFRVLTEQERLVYLYQLLHKMKGSSQQSAYLTQILCDWHNFKVVSQSDLQRYQWMEFRRMIAEADEDFAEELLTITRWFEKLTSAEQLAAYSSFLTEASFSQISFLCCHIAPKIIALT